MKKIIPLVVLGAVIVVAFIYGTQKYGGQSNTNSNGNESNTSTTTSADFTITMDDFSFTPNKIVTQAGKTITVKLKGMGVGHRFVIDELGVDAGVVFNGDEKIVTINIPSDASGKTFPFYCAVSNHKELGMTGTIRVD